MKEASGARKAYKLLTGNDPILDNEPEFNGMNFVWILFISIILFGLTMIATCSPNVAHADNKIVVKGFSNEAICQAIFLAEGGDKATYLYGIRSVKYGSKKEAKEICIRTIKNNRLRFYNQQVENPSSEDFISFISHRYCPIGAGNDPKGLNKNWQKNVRYFLNKKGA